MDRSFMSKPCFFFLVCFFFYCHQSYSVPDFTTRRWHFLYPMDHWLRELGPSGDTSTDYIASVTSSGTEKPNSDLPKCKFLKEAGERVVGRQSKDEMASEHLS